MPTAKYRVFLVTGFNICIILHGIEVHTHEINGATEV